MPRVNGGISLAKSAQCFMPHVFESLLGFVVQSMMYHDFALCGVHHVLLNLLTQYSESVKQDPSQLRKASICLLRYL